MYENLGQASTEDGRTTGSEDREGAAIDGRQSTNLIYVKTGPHERKTAAPKATDDIVRGAPKECERRSTCNRSHGPASTKVIVLLSFEYLVVGSVLIYYNARGL